ncbi:PAS domain-containing sensor histidine kinase [Desulfonatronum sp. SC1]|uniref:response regulator n=1 Tax=Desulfonatronum sp. SC1 TaxID=2109626 RepID=UPI000D320471|nr:PAS domain-containing sensor histidine kinase [Desulfonatronum sp. SC1]PTN37310.1 hypothetical protein C6366_06610 [Desulfonatronum sp. SC1]
MQLDQELIQRLEAEVRFLREQRRQSVEALEMAAGLGHFATPLVQAGDGHVVLREIAGKARYLMDLKAVSFFLVQPDHSFAREFCDPPDHAATLDREIDALINDHSFSRILRHGRSEILLGINRDERLVLHALATPIRMWGMFVGVLGQEVSTIPDTYLALLSIVLLAGAAALEGVETYQRLWEHQRELAHKAEDADRRYLQIVSEAPLGIFQATPEGRYLFVNPEYARMAGYAGPEEMVAQVTDIAAQLYVNPAERERYKELLSRHGQATGFEVELKRRDGRSFWASLDSRLTRDAQGNPVYNGFMTDITARKQAEKDREKLQAQLFQVQKVESVGILAGGVAHDFNNLLQAMSGNIEMLLQSESFAFRDTERLRTVARSMDRAAKLVEQLLLFSRKVESRKIHVDLNQEVRDVLQMLERTIPRMIALEPRLDPLIWTLAADPAQVQQVLLNLANNAVDAMPDGGRLEFRTVNACLDENFVAAHPGAAKGCHVLLSVTDTGCGMDQDVLDHAFDPFFTTKEVGKGTGLGLASVYGIVAAHGGFIECRSVRGQGTTFDIYWPAAETSAVPREEPAQVAGRRGGGETILVVDDEPELRELTREALEDFGYTVLSAATGEEALMVYKGRVRDIDLVLLDLNMPGMGGHKCLQELLRLDPEANVIIASGYARQGHGKNALTSGAKGFLGKPFQLRELDAKVREVLEVSGPKPASV